MSGYRRKTIQAKLKRTFDVLVSALGLVFLSPVIAGVWILIAVALGRPVLFHQRRIGSDGVEFTIFKFRTMKDLIDRNRETLPDIERMTRFGSVIRRLSLDELPELVNVLRGEMSIVGPRPLLPEYRDHYTPRQWRRHEVPPGIVGPVTAYGRNTLDWDVKMELDVWYVDNWSLRLDLKLLLRSIWAALKREGISADNHVTMPRFDEYKSR